MVSNMKDEASQTYSTQVAEIIAANPRNSKWAPPHPIELHIQKRRCPTTLLELAPIEQKQLHLIFRGVDLAQSLATNMLTDGELEEDFPIDLEVADITDGEGQLRYKLYGMNYGCIYLMAADSMECIAFAAQHDLEHWHADQRPLFWAMDRALAQKGHGFQQPMKFCWWEDKCWNEIAGKERGTVGSDPYLRKLFAGEADVSA